MPIRTACPCCKTALSAPDSPGPQRLKCPFCASIFTTGGNDFTLPEVPPAPPPTPARERLQTAKAPRPPAVRPPPPVRDPAPSVRKASPPVGGRSTPTAARGTPRQIPVALLVGAGVGLFGFFLLLVGGVVLWLVLRPSKTAPAAGPSSSEVAAADNLRPGVDPARNVAGGPRAVPEAPAGGGDEEFVDLPERGEGLGGIAGLNPEPGEGGGGGGGGPPAGRAPAADVRVQLMSGQISRVMGRGPPQTVLRITYRFEQGTPFGGARFGLVVAVRGNAYKMSINPGALQEQGTLTAQLPAVIGRIGPYRTFLILDPVGAPGGEEKISNELTLR